MHFRVYLNLGWTGGTKKIIFPTFNEIFKTKTGFKTFSRPLNTFSEFKTFSRFFPIVGTLQPPGHASTHLEGLGTRQQ